MTTADPIVALSWIVGLIAALIFAGVCAALALLVARGRRATEARLVYGHRGLELAWTVVPLAVLAVVFGLSLATLGSLRSAGAAAGEPLRIGVIGRQWWFEFRYDGTSVPNEAHIPVGVPILLELGSADVIHSFWVPGLGPKQDAIPGQAGRLRLYTERPGVYEGACTEFCGVEHAWMRVRVIAEPRADFDRWLAAQREPRAAPSGAAERGEQIFLGRVCVSCHQVRGTTAAATGGPDLTHLASRAQLASGVLENGPNGLRAWIADPERWKPGALMPRVALSPQELDAVVAYLGSLR